MRKHLTLFAPLLLAALLFGGCDVSSAGTLSDLSKPYAGTYVCTALTLGGEDLLGRFERVELELHGEKFTVRFVPLSGEEGTLSGDYTVSGEKAEFRVLAAGREYVRSCRREKGAILFEENVGGRLLYAEFRLP